MKYTTNYPHPDKPGFWTGVDFVEITPADIGKVLGVVQDANGNPAYALVEGGGGKIPQPATETPMPLNAVPSVGTSEKFALEDHVHEMPSAADIGAEAKLTSENITSAGDVSAILKSDILYHFTGALTSLTITFQSAVVPIPHYHFDFVEGSTAFDPVLPNGVVWPDGHTWEADTRYEVDILNGYAVVASWAVSGT